MKTIRVGDTIETINPDRSGNRQREVWSALRRLRSGSLACKVLQYTGKSMRTLAVDMRVNPLWFANHDTYTPNESGDVIMEV